MTVVKENNSTSHARNGTWALCPSLLKTLQIGNTFIIKMRMSII